MRETPQPSTSPRPSPQSGEGVERFDIPLRCRLDGREVVLQIAEAEAEAFRSRLDRVRVPIVGYRELVEALGKQGIKTCERTLRDMAARHRLPLRRFGRKVTFYLPEVMERIGGRS